MQQMQGGALRTEGGDQSCTRRRAVVAEGQEEAGAGAH
jgi:hypothetical protein